MSVQPHAVPAAQAPQYEERLILFLDFLGFKALVDRSVGEPAFLGRLVSAMDTVGRIGAGLAPIFRTQRVTQFSDSMVVSYAVTQRSAVFQLLNEIALTVVDLAERGFLVRGAITTGLLYHSDRHVVGPAMTEAYLLESKTAIYPRVLVDAKVLQVARTATQTFHTPDEEEAYARGFLARDEDGLDYLDYLSWRAVIEVTGGTPEYYPAYLEGIAELIREGLGHADPRVQAKFVWLRRKYAAALKSFRRMSPTEQFWQQNTYLCQALQSLPRLQREAAAARQAIKASQPAATTKKKRPAPKRS